MDGVAGADQADGAGHSFLESAVRFVDGRNARQGFGERSACGRRIVLQEFARHEGLGRVEIRPDGGEDLQNGRDVVGERDVHRFDLRPERKAAVRDDERVGIANARKKRE